MDSAAKEGMRRFFSLKQLCSQKNASIELGIKLVWPCSIQCKFGGYFVHLFIIQDYVLTASVSVVKQRQMSMGLFFLSKV